MALDDLKETIKTLRERIQAHRPIWKAILIKGERRGVLPRRNNVVEAR